MTEQETNENYYKYINTEHYPIKPGAMPRDVKRIIAFGEHQFNRRYYFVSESEIKILKGCRFPFRLSIKKQTKKSESFQLIDDNERRCILTINFLVHQSHISYDLLKFHLMDLNLAN